MRSAWESDWPRPELAAMEDETTHTANRPPPLTPEKFLPDNTDKINEVDGWGTLYFINMMKTVVLDATIMKLHIKERYVCDVNHTSQRQDARLFPLDEDYLQNNFYSVIKTLFQPFNACWSFITYVVRIQESELQDAAVWTRIQKKDFGSYPACTWSWWWRMGMI